MRIIRQSQSEQQSFDDFEISLTKKEKSEIKKVIKDLQKYYNRQAKEMIVEEINQHEEHLGLLRFCAMAFAQTSLSEKSGYQFYFTEPLIEFCTQHSKLKSFDLLLFNETTNGTILIECKTSVGPADARKDLDTAISLVQSQLAYLSQVIGNVLEKDEVEYVLCIYEKDRSKFEEAFK